MSLQIFEIEVKINHAIPYMEVMDKVHTYLDDQMPPRHKQAITWIKKHLKELAEKNRSRNKTRNNRNSTRNKQIYQIIKIIIRNLNHSIMNMHFFQ